MFFVILLASYPTHFIIIRPRVTFDFNNLIIMLINMILIRSVTFDNIIQGRNLAEFIYRIPTTFVLMQYWIDAFIYFAKRTHHFEYWQCKTNSEEG